MNESEPCIVKTINASGKKVRIELDFDILTDEMIKMLTVRLVKGAYVCEARYDLSKKKVVPRISNGVPELLYVQEATTDALIDALYRDRRDVSWQKRALERPWY